MFYGAFDEGIRRAIWRYATLVLRVDAAWRRDMPRHIVTCHATAMLDAEGYGWRETP